MAEINIGKTIIRKRKEKGITQEDLASFIGVSKASVSKWETGHSYPDVIFLPQLASYFDISLDELMSYEPQMTDDDIRKLYTELLKEFASKPFDEVINRCREITKKYFSCFPLLYQIGTLLVSYGSSSKDEEKRVLTVTEAKELFIRVKTLSDNIDLKKLALQSEAVCEMLLGNSNEVIKLLENESRFSYQPSIEAMLSQSYQTLGKIQEAKITIQESILDSVIILIFDLTSYLTLCTDDSTYFEEVFRRTVALDDIFRVRELYPIAILPFYLTAAEGYLTIGNPEKALTMLETFTEIITGNIFPLTLRGDDFFTLVNELKEKQLRELPFVMPELSRDEQSIKQELADTVINSPSYSTLHENQRFQDIVKKLKQML